MHIAIRNSKPHTKQEVGEESRLARSFDRIRSIVRKKRNKEKNENDENNKLEKIVTEVIIRQRIQKKQYAQMQQHAQQQFTAVGVVPQSTLYRHSYQVC